MKSMSTASKRKSTREKAKHGRRDPSFDATVGAVMKTIRLDRDMTQEAFAKATGIERAFISEIERGIKGMTLITFYRLASALDTQPHSILEKVDGVVWPFHDRSRLVETIIKRIR